MCIICYKPKGVKMPKESTMKNCFESNPHGAGYMFRRNGIVHVRKGFMTFDAFTADVDEQNITKKDDVVFHFRIATHSKVSPENTHPFPITSVRSELHELLIDCKRALVHNGILHDFVDTTDDISDSAFFAKMLFPCQRESQYKAILNCHNKTSKFVVMTSKFTIVSGNFVKKFGCSFSNYGYEDPVIPTVYTPSQWAVGNGVITLPSGHTFDTTAGCTGFGGKYNVYDDDYEKDWEKLYGVDGDAVRQYDRNKNRRGSSGGQVISQAAKSFHTTVQTKVQVNTLMGTPVDVENHVDKKVPLPSVLVVNGHQISFSDGVTDEMKLDIIRKYCRETEERIKFQAYLRGDDANSNYRKSVVNDRLPFLNAESPEKIVTVMINDQIDENKLIDLLKDGYRLKVNDRYIGKKNDIIIVKNAKGIVKEKGQCVTIFNVDHLLKFYRGGFDDNVIISVRTDAKLQDYKGTALPTEGVKSVDKNADTKYFIGDVQVTEEEFKREHPTTSTVPVGTENSDDVEALKSMVDESIGGDL